MKQVLLLGIGLLLAAPPAYAIGVDLSANACPISPGASSDAGVLDCAGGQLLRLYVTFQPAEPISDFIAIEGTLSLQVSGNLASNASFWDFHGCDPSGLSVSHVRPTSMCTGYTSTWPTGSLESWSAYMDGPSTLRVNFVMARPSPFAVALNQKLFGLEIDIDASKSAEAGGGPCNGCTLPVCLVVNCLHPISKSGTTTTTLTSGSAFGNFVTINGGLGTQCLAVGSQPVAYRDADGDGWGDFSNSVAICGRPIPTGYVSNDGDCDDSSAANHPGATEICDGHDNNCNGQIDEMAQAPGLVGWWKAEGNANDATGSNNGVLRNGAAFAAGQVGQAFSLDGSNDYVDGLGTAPTFSFIQNTGIFTIEGWVRLDDPDALKEQVIAATTITTADKGYYFSMVNSSGQHQLDLFLTRGEIGIPIIDSRSPEGVITAGWHHVAAVGNGSQVTFYVDGVAYPGSGTMGTLSSGNSVRAMNIGWDAPFAFDGMIDELAIYNRALSASEIQAIYNTGTAGRCALVGVDDPRPAARAFEFAAPWPNPAGRAINLEFQLPASAAVHADVVDVAGRRVSRLLQDGVLAAGAHHLQWDGRDASGQQVAPGVYLFRISTGAAAAVRRIIVIK